MPINLTETLRLLRQCQSEEYNRQPIELLVHWAQDAELFLLQTRGSAVSSERKQRLAMTLPLLLDAITELNKKPENTSVCENLMNNISLFYQWLNEQSQGISDAQIMDNWQQWSTVNEPNDNLNEQNFLIWNKLLNQVVEFAINNQYQTPTPDGDFVALWASFMRELFVVTEQIQLLPHCISKKTLQDAAQHYQSTTEGLVTLFMACPDPEAARGWFDYQHEYKERLQQLENLRQLIEWCEQFYNLLLVLAPPLPIPYPPGQTVNPESGNSNNDTGNSVMRL